MSKRKPIDVEELKKFFRLKDEKLERLNKKYKGGKWLVVENKSNDTGGYCQLSFKGRVVRYHTLIWILATGEDIPEGMDIDHINGNRVDNRLENLRLVTRRENIQNMKVHREGKLVGCSFDKRGGRYNAEILIGNKRVHLGLCNTEEEAHGIYVSACKHIDEYVDNASFRELIKT